jgi:hypothetical protein
MKRNLSNETPPVSMQKINWNVAIDTSIGRLGMGFIVRDHKGFHLATKSRTKLANLEPVAAQGIGNFLCNQIQQTSQSKKYFF